MSSSGRPSGRFAPGCSTGPCSAGRPRLPGRLGAGARRNVTFLRKRPTSASCSVAARNCSMVAMPASTLNRRFSALSGKAAKSLGHGLLARRPKAGAAHQADPDPTNQDHGRERGDEVGLHRPLGPMAVAFAQQRAPLLVGPQPGHGRGVDGMDGPPLPAQAHGLDGQARQAPRERPIKQRIQRHLAPLHGAFDPMPPPAQMEHVGQGGTGEASLVVDELASKHGDEHDADKVRGARRQRAHQVVHCTRRQVHWQHGQRLGGMGWFRHPPSISELWPLWLLLW